MRNLLNPRWLFIINTLPIVVLFSLAFGQYTIIHSLLDEGNIQLWEFFGLALAILGTLNFGYAIYLTITRQTVSAWYAVCALLFYIPYIYLCGFHLDNLMPFSIPQWMVSGNILIYVGTFLMPTIAYALFVLVLHFTPATKQHKAWVNFLIAIGIPILGYIFSQTILPLWQRVEDSFPIHILMILIIVTTLVFLFFLVRAIYVLMMKKSSVWRKYQLAWKIPIAIVFPILGLLVNQGHVFNIFSHSDSGVFGDFGSPWYYGFAIFNGILLCLPNLENRNYRLILFFGRSITFAFTLYFFLVFLPFLPLSVVAIVAFGTGFLMLTPLLLFLIHSNELAKDVFYLRHLFSTNHILALAIVGFLLIPASITFTYLKDKSVLNETLAYLYSPDYSKQYDIDKASLENTLKVIKNHKDYGRGFVGISETRTPYLSSYFNWLVLDNLTLSESKINTIEKVFFDTSSSNIRSENIANQNVSITNISANSTYDNSQNAWKSWVDLEISNNSKLGFAEYATTIALPVGCWITDYYLYVGNRKEPGILAEKKSAMWVFSQIRNENKDPGILYYLTGNKVAFRVFPFAENEVRKTGIEFLHKEPMTLQFDHHTVTLGNEEHSSPEIIETANIIYVSANQKQALQSVQRKPYFHFLVDVSKGTANQKDVMQRIEAVSQAHPTLMENAKVSFVNTYVNTMSLTDDWKQHYQSQTMRGGFYLDRAIRSTLVSAHNNNSYPVIAVVTDSLETAIIDKDFSDLQFTFPESELFYNLVENGKLQPHSLTTNPLVILPDSLAFDNDSKVLEFRLPDNTVTYLPDNNQPSIILKTTSFDLSDSEINEKDWSSALAMEGMRTSQLIHPETADKQWLEMVRYSFMSKIMTPVTSYLVVENEAQKAILKKKQDQILSGNKSLDPGDDIQRMSEPSWIILTILLVLILWFRQSRRTRLLKKP